jgi:hypothetical protein
MSYTYLFVRPAKLPLDTSELSELTVLPLSDAEGIRASLERHVPGLRWDSATDARADVDGRWLELRLPEADDGDTLAMRCSLRHDYADIVQRLCDACGWVAFDQTPRCYQPHREPIAA